jgi:multimeric flavodoxin WrbA
VDFKLRGGIQMKVVAFNGSSHKEGNTAILINYALAELRNEGIETEIVQVGGRKIRGCIACFKCLENQDEECSVKDDIANECIKKMSEADGVILGSPTYFTDVTPEIKALIDRAGFVSRVNDFMFKRKAGAAIVAVRRAGATHVFDTINHFFLISQMIVPGSDYWNVGVGRDQGEVEKDEEGLQTVKLLGRNMAWLLKNLSK